jgi:hypothetical protein
MATSEAGYGVHGVRDGVPGEIAYAHRTAWELAYGPIPEGVFVCHTCDVRSCINHEHLFLGTALDNNRDMASKGRAKSGRGGKKAKLNEHKVSQIRDLREQGWTIKQLAERFECSEGHISATINRRKWKET